MGDYTLIGQSPSRIDGPDKVTGRAVFADDVVLPGMLHGKILRSPYPHARVLRVDTAAAERLPGVKAIITGKDSAGVRYGTLATMRLPADEHPLAEDRVRFVGAEVAAVAAVDEEVAEEALGLIRVEYEPLPAVFTPQESMREDAPRLHDIDFGSVSGDPRHKNLSGRTFIELGDVERGFAEADYVREDHFETQPTAHCALEPHVALASYEPSGKLHLWLSSMGVFYKRNVLSACLGLATGQIRVHKTYVGGAFGGKISVYSYEYCAALLSIRTGQPVKIKLTREEVFATTRQRHPTSITVKTGIRRSGEIVAQDIRLVADNGAYRCTGPIVAFLAHAFNVPIYRVPNYRYEGLAVYTNNPLRGPQRGHGAPQIRFAVDSQLHMMARELGLDVMDVMRQNLRRQGDVLPNGDPLATNGLEECVTQAASALERTGSERSAFAESARHKTGIGMSLCSMFNGAPVYPYASAAVVNLNDDGGLTLFTGTTEMGQGAETAMAQIAAEEMGVPFDRVHVVSGDSELCPPDIGNYLSCGVYVTGKAVRAAAVDARQQLLSLAAEEMEAPVDDLVIRDGRIYVKGTEKSAVSVASVVLTSLQKRAGNPIVGRGYVRSVPGAERYPDVSAARERYTNAYSFAAQVAKVDVDTETGQIKLLRADTVFDCGYPLNPALCTAQLEGSVSMAQGQALTENVLLEEGRVVNPSLRDYVLPCSLDTADNRIQFVETLDPGGPFGAKEVGEGGVAGMLAAIANAVYEATGVRVTSLPITPEKLLQGLEQRAVRSAVD